VTVTLYLASTSPARLATHRAAGIEPVAIAPGVDEDAAVAAAGPLTPADMVMLLARLKAEAVAAAHPELDGLIFGGDSAFEFDGTVYGKPHRPEIARERWLAHRGRSGRLHSGHWLIDARADGTGKAIGAAAVATVNFATDITESEIDAYIATGEPLEVAGAFTIDAKGAAYIDSIEGDPHAVVGLSIPLLRTLTRSLAIEWHDVWNR
jgi:septum formation protein